VARERLAELLRRCRRRRRRRRMQDGGGGVPEMKISSCCLNDILPF
jgi:hypothetical protein